MKNFLLLLVCFCFNHFVLAQNKTDFKPELKKITDDLAQQIKLRGNKKIAVANFVDLQGNVTELGRYLAQQFSVNLIRNQMDVVDRSRLDILMDENKMNSKGLLDPKNQAKLGQMAGIEIIVTGTTSPFDNTVELTVSAIDVTRGSACAAADGTIPRTEAINSLLRSQVGNGSGSSGLSSASNSPYIPQNPGRNQDPSEALLGDRSLDLPKSQCLQNMAVYGQVYFENTLKEDLVISRISGKTYFTNEIKIAAGTKNSSPLLFVETNSKIESSAEYVFHFHTAEEDEGKWRYGTMSVVVNGCKVKVHAINSNRLFMKKKN